MADLHLKIPRNIIVPEVQEECCGEKSGTAGSGNNRGSASDSVSQCARLCGARVRGSACDQDAAAGNRSRSTTPTSRLQPTRRHLGATASQRSNDGDSNNRDADGPCDGGLARRSGSADAWNSFTGDCINVLLVDGVANVTAAQRAHYQHGCTGSAQRNSNREWGRRVCNGNGDSDGDCDHDGDGDGDGGRDGDGDRGRDGDDDGDGGRDGDGHGDGNLKASGRDTRAAARTTSGLRAAAAPTPSLQLQFVVLAARQPNSLMTR